jgi:hypothetical protein
MGDGDAVALREISMEMLGSDVLVLHGMMNELHNL